MILPPAVFMQLETTCAPQVAPKMLAVLARIESGFDPLAIGDNTTRRTIRSSDKGEAIATARRLIGEGHNLDLGLMQINDRNLNWLGLTLDRAFDACASIRAAADYLMTVSRYDTGSPTRGFRNGYVQKFVRASLRHEIPAAPRPVSTAEEAVYNTGSPRRGFFNGYVQRVVASVHALPAVFVHRTAPAAPHTQPSWRAFAAASSEGPKSWDAFSHQGGQ